MKKFFLFSISAGIILFSALFFSCEDNSDNECSTCKSENYQKVIANLGNLNFDFKQYDSDADDFHFLFNKFNNTDFGIILEKTEISKITNVDFKELVGFCLITTKEKVKNKNFKVENNEIKGVLLYSIGKDDSMKIRFFIKKDNSFIEDKISNIEIGYITSNEIVDFANIFFRSSENTTFLITNSSYKMIEHKNNNLLKAKLSNLHSNKYDNKPAPPKTCGLGCTKNDGYPCALFNNGNMGCKEDDNCPKDEAERKLLDSNNNDYDYTEITYDLYYFRSNYLLSYDGGEKIMKDYYELGKNLPVSFYTIQNCIELFDFLEKDIIPLTNSLSLSPNSSSILIDDSLKIKLTNYLLNIKNYYTEQADKDKIDSLITKLDFYSNKSNDFITNNLHLY